MTDPVLLRPELPIRIRRTAIMTSSLLVGGAMLAGAVAVAALQRASEVSVALPAIVLTVPSAPEVAAQPAAVLAEPPPAAYVEPAPLRSLVPVIAAECVSTNDDELPEQCGWHDGFPAIAGDGSLIAVKYYDNDTGADISGLSIHFVDARTSRTVRSEIVMTAAEIDASRADTSSLRRRIEKRAARIQRVLDAGSYRALQPLGGYEVSDAGYEKEAMTDADVLASATGDELLASATLPIHADFNGAVVRIVDPRARAILGRIDFTLPSPNKRDADSDCAGWTFRRLDVAWDPTTKTVLGTSEHDEGGCMCATIESHTVKHLR